ncbi:hypothetical protein [Nocardiopsis composta]|uniref:Uncharacterized protein n=1 Tax=Nocardiopsis composta TaxID=157465 RepID=A0A7W8QL92_9ACTN|nr:hypothetical protein [Nocardiopsis composta]MBB5432526.1 hypothetical protein [Nocardiopsis composta]
MNDHTRKKSALLAGLTALALLVSPLTGTALAGEAPAGQRAFVASSEEDGTRVTLSITLDAGPDGAAPELTEEELAQLDELTAEPTAALEAAPAAAEPFAAAAAGKAKGPATLRCGKNPSRKDGNGTPSARFNCRASTIDRGHKISAKVKSIITGKVHETGARWRRNGKSMPKNAPHTVGKNYHFHGSFKPVEHGDKVQFQDFMKFRVKIGGKTGNGTITWASNVKAEK